MSTASADDENPLDPAAASMMAKVRGLMVISGVTTMLAIAAVLGVIGYRVFTVEGSATAADVTALLPKGARVEIAVSWPAQLNGSTPLKLVAIGVLVRSEEKQAAIAIQSYEFKTRGLSL